MPLLSAPLISAIAAGGAVDEVDTETLVALALASPAALHAVRRRLRARRRWVRVRTHVQLRHRAGGTIYVFYACRRAIMRTVLRSPWVERVRSQFYGRPLYARATSGIFLHAGDNDNGGGDGAGAWLRGWNRRCRRGA
jgi:hypothetical protein